MGTVSAVSKVNDELAAAAPAQAFGIVSAMSAESEAAQFDANRGESRLGELLQAVAKKDRKAFEAFYDATTDRALNLVLRITQKIDIAEDVISDVYLQVWQQADRFDPARGNALAWLTIICRSRALDTLRKNNTAPTSGAAPMSEVPEPTSEEFPQDLLIAVEQHSAVHAALEKLEPEQRQLLALAYFRGYSHSELANITGMPLGTVKTKVRRTLLKLKELVLASENPQAVSA